MHKKSLIILICITIIGTVGAFSFMTNVNNNDAVALEETNKNSDYESLLAPYKSVLDDFNDTHNTSYGFMTEETLERYNIDREEYLEEMVNEYSKMTLEEFATILEQAYKNDKMIFAENLPFYQKEVKEELVTVTIDSDSIFQELSENN